MFITLFSSRCIKALLRFLPASANRTNMQERNQIPDPNQHMLTFLHPTLMFRVTYWAPVGMLLRATPLTLRIWTYASVYHIQNDVQVISTYKREIL